MFFRFLGYFGVGWPPCWRFDPPLKNPWRRPCVYGFRQKSKINDFQMKITDDLEWNFEKCLNRFNSMGSLYKISNFVKSWDFSFKGEISVCAAQPDPTRPHHAFEKLISLERVDRFTSGLLCSMSPFNKFRIWPTPIPAAPVTAMARGTCRGGGVGDMKEGVGVTDGEGVGDTLSIGNSTTAGPIAFKFGVCLETS